MPTQLLQSPLTDFDLQHYSLDGYLIDDCGRMFNRGTWVDIDESTWNRFQSSPISDQFLFRATGQPACC